MKGAGRTNPTLPQAGQEARHWRPAAGYLVLAIIAALAGPLWWIAGSTGDEPSSGLQTLAERSAERAGSSVTPGSATPAVAPLAADAAPVAAPPPESRGGRAAQPAMAPTAAALAQAHEPSRDPTPDLADYVNRGEQPTMGEVISRLNAAGVHSGLGAFSPPGTKPPLVGLAVPEDFALPPGYVRHHQATDDGQRIEAVLMFAPDARFVDATGRQLALPADRVVPPELAPPGLPIRRIVIPTPVEPRR